jgi:signal transduction histidine kinase
MTDAERVLAVLIHDVRTPLGVAHGYLRLIRTDRLPGPEDRDRALAGTQEALAKISRLCQEAGGFLEDPQPGSGHVPASQLADRVAAVLAERGIELTGRQDLAGTVTVGTSVDRAAEAIATLLGLYGRKPGAIVAVGGTATALRFLCGALAPGGSDQALDSVEHPFDPWHSSPGLGVALAHRAITALGGRIWTAPNHGLALALSVPWENRNE